MISVQGLSKRYRLGQIGAATLRETVEHWLAGRRRAPHPTAHAASAPGRNEIWALRDVSFEVQQGEVLGIIGRNGAGKSTLLKILSRITEPTAGRAILRGRVASLLEVGTGFHPDLTGRENMYLNGAILGMKKAEIDRKFDEIVEFAEIGRFIDTPVKRYSSGMYVRLAFAVAAHLEPEIMLVDEVLAVGDLAFQRKCIGKMETVAKGGRTVLFVSHNMAAIKGLCSRAILLEGGRLVHDGTAAETVAAYVASVQKLTAEQPLATRTDREGGEILRFTGVVFRDAKSRAPLNILVSGQDVVADVTYDCRSAVPLNNVVVAIALNAADGAFLSACRSDAIGKEFRLAPGTGCLRCRIPRFPFSQGRFSYNLIAYQQGVILDWIKEAGFVDVAAGDFYGTGKIPAPASQCVFIDFDWEML